MLLLVPDALDALVPLSLLWMGLLRLRGPRWAADCSPSTAVRLLSSASVATTLCAVTAGLAVLGVVMARLPFVSRWGRWPLAALPEPGVSWLWAIPLVLLALTLLVLVVRHVAIVVRELWLAEGLCRTFDAAAGGAAPMPTTPPDLQWTVVPSDQADAYALPGLPLPSWTRPASLRPGATKSRRTASGRGGRIVISSAMVAALETDHQRVLIEHERSHLLHHHHLWVQLSETAGLLNPLLRPLPGLVRAAAERQADLDAAQRVGDAALTARAIAAASLARTRAGRRRDASVLPQQPLGATGSDVVNRVRYLLTPTSYPAPGRRRGDAVLSLIIVVSLFTGLATTYSLVARLEHARTANSGLQTGAAFQTGAAPATGPVSARGAASAAAARW